MIHVVARVIVWRKKRNIFCVLFVVALTFLEGREVNQRLNDIATLIIFGRGIGLNSVHCPETSTSSP